MSSSYVPTRSTLAARVGVPERSIEAARELGRWARAQGEPGLALAVWEGCAALDDAPASWLEVAELALVVGDAARAWDAAVRVASSPTVDREARAAATLLFARVCLFLGRRDEASAWLASVRDDVGEPGRLARALEAAIALEMRQHPAGPP